MEFLFILYKPIVHLLNYKAVYNQPKQKQSHILGKYKIFPERLKDTTDSKYNFVKTFDVRHDDKCYRVSQGITGS